LKPCDQEFYLFPPLIGGQSIEGSLSESMPFIVKVVHLNIRICTVMAPALFGLL
jgi:hypothetical protein